MCHYGRMSLGFFSCSDALALWRDSIILHGVYRSALGIASESARRYRGAYQSRQKGLTVSLISSCNERQRYLRGTQPPRFLFLCFPGRHKHNYFLSCSTYLAFLWRRCHNTLSRTSPAKPVAYIFLQLSDKGTLLRCSIADLQFLVAMAALQNTQYSLGLNVPQVHCRR